MKRKFTLLPENKALGHSLKQWLQTHTISTADFSKKINITQKQLEKYLQGLDTMPIPVIDAIAEKYRLYIPQKTLRRVVALRDHSLHPTDELSEIYKTLWDHFL